MAGDEASLALILRNLISNAGKYAGPDAKVHLAVTTDASGAVAIRVEDDGPGIDPDEADALFGLYFRSASSAPAPGSGIGLFVCRHLVAAMGGQTWAHERSGGGAEFGFTLPAWPDEIVEADMGDVTARPAATRAAIDAEARPAIERPAAAVTSRSLAS